MALGARTDELLRNQRAGTDYVKLQRKIPATGIENSSLGRVPGAGVNARWNLWMVITGGERSASTIRGKY